jgi:hypothetical protein
MIGNSPSDFRWTAGIMAVIVVDVAEITFKSTSMVLVIDIWTRGDLGKRNPVNVMVTSDAPAVVNDGTICEMVDGGVPPVWP